MLHPGEVCLGLKVIASRRVKNTVLVAAQGSVLDFTGAAIVNAANEGCLGGGGVDGAITAAGGKALAEARRALLVLDKKQTRCNRGDAVTTVGGDLKNEWCIHAVGPNYRMLDSVEQGDDVLTSAYSGVLREAEAKKMPSLGLSLLSAGIFRGEQSLSKVLEIAVNTVADHVYPELEFAVLCAFTDAEVGCLQQAIEALPEGHKDNGNTVSEAGKSCA